jgi:hypothetical protein
MSTFVKLAVGLALQGVVEFKFGDGFFRHPSAPSRSATHRRRCKVGLVHHFEGDFHAVGIAGGHVLHPDGEDAGPDARGLDGGAMFLQISAVLLIMAGELAGLGVNVSVLMTPSTRLKR